MMCWQIAGSNRQVRRKSGRERGRGREVGWVSGRGGVRQEWETRESGREWDDWMEKWSFWRMVREVVMRQRP
jgi:hypothetical protein